MKITDLTVDTAPSADDLIVTVDGTTGRNKKVTIGSLPFVGGTSGTNLTTTAAPTTITINSDNGTDAIIAAADATNAGVFLPTEKAKLAGVATGATANALDSQLRDRSTHTGTQVAATISDFSEAVDDRVAALVVAGAGITSVYNDAANTLTLSATSSGGGGQVTVTKTVAPSGGDYTTLQAAIAAASAGWEIKLLPGTYTLTANLTVSLANITIRGSGPSSVIDTDVYLLDSTGLNFTLESVKLITSSSNDVILNLHADYWTVKNCWVDGRNASSCFVAYGYKGRMTDNLIQVYGHFQGFNFNGASHCIFSNNVVTIEEIANNGIVGFNSSNLLVSDNQFLVTSGATQFHRNAIGLTGDFITFNNNKYVASDVNGGGIRINGVNCAVIGNTLLNIDTGNSFGIIGYGFQVINSSGKAVIANNVLPTGNITVDNAGVTVRNNITIDSSGDNTIVIPRQSLSADFSTIARYNISLNNSTSAVTNSGIKIAGSATNYSGIIKENSSGAVPLFDKNPSVTWQVAIDYMSSYTSDQYYVLGFNNGGSYAWANGAGKYIGFHVNNSFGTVTIEGVNGDGTNHTATALSPATGINGYSPIMTAVMKSATKVDFYVDGAFLGTSTTNLPAGSPSNGLWAAIFYSTSVAHGGMTASHLAIDYDAY
jgi:hypothetical protein